MLKRLLWYYVSSLSFWRRWKLLQHLSTRENESNLCQNLLTIEHSDLKARALSYANEALKNFCKLAKRTKRRKYQKRFWLWLSIVWETLELTWYQIKEFSFITFLYRTKAKAYAFNCEIEVLFSTLKNSPFPLVWSIRLHIGAMDLIPSLIPSLILCHGCEKSAKKNLASLNHVYQPKYW